MRYKDNPKNMKSLEGFFYSLPQKGKIKAMKTEKMREKVKKNGKSGKRKDEKIRR